MRFPLMRYPLNWAIMLGCCTAAAAQSGGQMQAPDPQKVQTGAQDLGAEMGFRYKPPAGWTVLATKPLLAPANAQPIEGLTKKGSACIQVSLSAEHGDPPSVIVVVGLPLDCYGQTMSAQDLMGFGSGVAEGLKQELDISGPATASYALGSHTFWIERAKGSPKGQTAFAYTVEVACTLLKKGVVCWLVTAADMASLRDFEQAAVELEGDKPAALVPDAAFPKPAP